MATSYQFKIRQQCYRITFNFYFFVLCLLFFALLVRLGVWQLQRYHYKEALQQAYRTQATQAPQPLNPNAALAALQFKRVSVHGHYLPALTVLLQNITHAGQTGYEVLTPLQLQGQNTVLLIDRGWVAVGQKNLLMSPELTREQNVVGNVKLLNEYQFILGENTLAPAQKPLLLQKIDTAYLSQLWQRPVYPFMLRLDAQAPLGYVRDWSPQNFNPERHMGYAVQWFLMAAVLVIAYISFCLERVKA